MILAHSLSRRFLLYFFVINSTFTLLFNLIECFEKLTRTKSATVELTLTFIKLNFIPSFFDNFPLATWFAIVLLIRELDLYGEWEGLKLLSIKPRSIFYIIGCISLGLSGISYIGKEKLFLHLFKQAESVKTNVLKHNNGTTIDETWLTLNNHTFCHIHYFDQATNQGDGLTLITTNEHGIVKTVLLLNKFIFNEQEQKVFFEHGTLLKSGHKKIISQAKISIPCLSKNNNQSTDSTLLTILESKEDPEIWSKKINRFLAHINTLFFPLITILIFFMTQNSLHSWMITLTTYPTFLGITAIAQWLINQNFSRLYILMPYVLFLFFILFLSLKKMLSNRRYTIQIKKNTD